MIPFASVAVLAQEREFKPDKKITFKDFDKDALDLHVFLPAGWDPGDKRATAVFFFGGG